jgi:hypothetical protein
MRRGGRCLFLALVWLSPMVARAQSAATCSGAYEKAQEEKAAGHLNAALGQLRVCVAQACPKFIREDCSRWIDQTEASLPSVVFAVRRDGKDQTEVEVLCDGVLLAQSSDGKAIVVDPGAHNFSFSIPGFAPVEQRLIVREGERNRIIDVEFRTASETRSAIPAPALDTQRKGPPSESVVRRPFPWSYGFAGLGALGITGFAVFAMLGSNQQRDLERSCAPYCQSGQVDSLKTKYLIADACLGVGLISLGVATYLYITGRASDSDGSGRPRTSSVSFVPRSSGSGGVLQLSAPF